MTDSETSEGASIRFECPNCGSEIDRVAQRDTDWISCEQCGQPISLASQLAMARALDNYSFAQELATPELLNSRVRPGAFSPQAKDALRAYQKAFTGIQLALRSELPTTQQERATEIMAEIAFILQRNQMISVLEARYWTQLMVCHTARQEYRTIQNKLQQPRPGLLTRLFRFPHWRLRRLQLHRALERREERLKELEQNLAFVDALHVPRGVPET